MGLLAVFLWPMARPPTTTLAECLIGIPLLLGFLRDGLAASGYLDPQHPRYLRLKTFLSRLAFTWLPPVLRLVLGLTAGLRLASSSAAAVRTGGGAPGLAWLLPGGPLLPDWLAPALGGPSTLTRLLSAATVLVQALALLALLAGRAVSPAALMFLLLAASRAFLSGLGLETGLEIGAALLLYLFRPADGGWGSRPPPAHWEAGGTVKKVSGARPGLSPGKAA
jgi:hypothetical protein